MLPLLSWSVVAVLLALWSLALWLAHAAAAWAVASAGRLEGEAPLRLPDAISAWLWPELAAAAETWLSGLAPVVDGLLQAAPALVGALTVLAWGLWGVGGALLLALGAGVHLLLAHGRRAEATPPPGAAR